jgi:hypothetical protein
MMLVIRRVSPRGVDPESPESYARSMTGSPRFPRWPRLTRPFGLRVLGCSAFAAVMFATGCSAGTKAATGGSAATTSNAPRPKTSATLQIVSPAPNDRTGPDVQVTMRLGGAHLAPASQTGGAVRPDEGHLHLSLDGALIAMPLRLAERLPRLRAGSHTVEAEFVASDHMPFDNRVVAAVSFDVR